MRWSLVLLPIVCGACDSPCEPNHLPDAPNAGPGELRHGLSIVTYQLDVAATSGSIACLSCGFVYYFDDALREQSRAAAGVTGIGKLAVADGRTFVLDVADGLDPDFGDDTFRLPNFQLYALSREGDGLWRNDLGDGEAWTGDFAPVEQYGYLRRTPTSLPVAIAANSLGVFLHGAPLASAFDAAQGRLLWTVPTGVDDKAAVAPDASVGLFVAGHEQTASGAPQAVLRHLDSEGSTTWTATWGTTLPPPLTQGRDIAFTDATRSADSGLLVAGYFTTATLDAGGHTLQDPDNPASGATVNFVAALDANGATRWAYTVGHQIVNQYIRGLKIAAVGDGAVICGEYGGLGDQLGLAFSGGSVGAFVAHVTASGVISAYSIGGLGAKSCQAIAAAPDGSAIVTVQTIPDLANEIRIGTRTFAAAASSEFFLLNIAL
ncbi:MAG TPA: hypothetical protein VHT91_19580 [Kofleriaceae bacterium]|jgi:hypothetical protein|nr:hypothetical protein [Kofleriaceae bacterium]